MPEYDHIMSPVQMQTVPKESGSVPSKHTLWPRVQVIVTSYNYARYITQALDSVAAQDYPHLQCIIVDDGSTDGSVSSIEEWISRKGDARFRLVRTPRNLGQLGACAFALAAGDSEFVAFLDADDYWHVDHLRQHVRAHLNARVASGLSCSDMVQVDAASRMLSGTFGARGFAAAMRDPRREVIAPETLPIWHQDGPEMSQGAAREADTPPVRFVPSDLFQWHWTATSALMFRRSVIELMMPNPTPDGRFEADQYMLQACHCFTGSILIGSATAAYRRHGGNGYSSLPIYSGTAARTIYKTSTHTSDNFVTLLTHIVNCQETFESLFGKRYVHAVILRLAGNIMRKRNNKNSLQLTRMLGPRRVAAAWLFEHWRRLRK